MPASLKTVRRRTKSSIDIRRARASIKSLAVRISSTRALMSVASGSGRAAAAGAPVLCIAINVRRFSSSSCSTCFWWKIAPRVLFLREKQSRVSPSHSTKLIGGGGSMGVIRTTEDSTFGGGRKLCLPTLMR
eukprot:Amastigsp_a841500_1778.p5 type:complete len:132 gc:universal Amastigsp_a841500_1778:963-568(-)